MGVWVNGMAFEKRLPEVAPQAFTSDGTVIGVMSIANTTCLFKVKQDVLLTATGLPPLELEIKCILDANQMILGPRGGSIKRRTDISAYTVALSAAIEAHEQQHPAVPVQEIERFVYEEEPTVAYRNILVDCFGDIIDSSNPLPVDATISTTSVGTPTIFNIDAALKDTQYSQLLPDNTAQFLLRARNSAKVQVAYTAGQTNSNFLTIIPGNIYVVEAVKLVGKTVYFQANKDNTVIEIVVWN